MIFLRGKCAINIPRSTFRDMHKELCDGKPGLCDAMKPTKGTELLKYLRKVDFEGKNNFLLMKRPAY